MAIWSIPHCHCKAIHNQRNDTYPTVIPQICACISQVLIGWKFIFGYMVQWQQIYLTVKGCCSLAFHYTMYLLLLDHVSKNQVSTNQSEFVQRTGKFTEWPLDMYPSAGHSITLHSVHTCPKRFFQPSLFFTESWTFLKILKWLLCHWTRSAPCTKYKNWSHQGLRLMPITGSFQLAENSPYSTYTWTSV